MIRRKRHNSTVLPKSEYNILLSQGTNGKQVDGCTRGMEAVIKDKNDSTTTRHDAETNRTTSQCLKKATVSRLDRGSKSGIIGPK